MTMRKMSEWNHLCVSSSASILDAAGILQDTSTRIVLIVDENSILKGIVTDGDIRRGLLAGISVEEPCERIMNSSPLTVSSLSPLEEIVRISDEVEADAFPIVSDTGQLQGVWVSHSRTPRLRNPVVIMAGGRGVRLRPMTSSIPKPLVAVGDKPMLHRLLDRMRVEGFENIAISINYLGEQIERSVGDGSQWGLTVDYLREDKPLGTAGALSLLHPHPKSPVLVINADVVTEARYRDLINQHDKGTAAITVGMRVHDIEHPFGVLDLEGSTITGIREKPVWREFVSAGVYVLAPEVFDLIPVGKYLDMPDLITIALERGLDVQGFPFHESWLDVGTPDDVLRAQERMHDSET